MSRRLLPSLLFGVIVLTACKEPSKPPVEPAPASPESRREALRERLQQQLGADYDAPVLAGSQQQQDQGAAIYRQLCLSCHGPGGHGDGPTGSMLRPPPSSLVDPQSAGFFSDRAQIEIIRNGSPGTTMIGWSGVLSDEDVQNVFFYTRSLREASTPDTPSSDSR